MKKEVNKYSYNCGQPVKELVVPTLAEGIQLFNKLQRTGKVFRVDFIKKSDNSVRTMVCRCGVHSKTNGKGAKYNALEKGLLTVWEFGKGYKVISIDNILLVKFGGVAYAFSDDLPKGKYQSKALDLSGRTIPARTSPMYN